MPRSSSSPFEEQKQRIAAEQARLAKELAVAEKATRKKPTPVRPALEPDRHIKLRVTAPRTVLPPRPHEHIFPGGRGATTRRLSRRSRAEVRLQRIKFLALCFMFAALILFFWRHLP